MDGIIILGVFSIRITVWDFNFLVNWEPFPLLESEKFQGKNPNPVLPQIKRYDLKKFQIRLAFGSDCIWMLNVPLEFIFCKSLPVFEAEFVSSKA